MFQAIYCSWYFTYWQLYNSTLQITLYWNVLPIGWNISYFLIFAYKDLTISLRFVFFMVALEANVISFLYIFPLVRQSYIIKEKQRKSTFYPRDVLVICFFILYPLFSWSIFTIHFTKLTKSFYVSMLLLRPQFSVLIYKIKMLKVKLNIF